MRQEYGDFLMLRRKYSLPLFLSFLIFSSILLAKNNNVQKGTAALAKTSALDPQRTLSNINNWAYWMYADGQSGITVTGQSGGEYPRGTTGTIFRDGFIWGAKVNGNIRVGGQTYVIGTISQLNDRIYRIRSDWAILNHGLVAEEAGEFFELATEAVTEALADQIIEQYKEDWKNWPVDQGAPYVDVNANGVYDPVLDADDMADPTKGDYPGIISADQVIWLKVDDHDSAVTQSLYGSDPLGIELDVTVWGYNQRSLKIGQGIYKKIKIKNISSDIFEEMYLSQWSDPDIGDSKDDLVGCDSIANIAFAYNGYSNDNNFSDFGIVPPAVGYTLLQGPVIPSQGDTAFFDFQKLPDYKNLHMTSFIYYFPGNHSYSDPELGSYDGSLQWYNLLRGNRQKTNTENPISFTHRNTGQETNYPLNGDPVAGTGDVDGSGENFDPADRRMALNSGPFTLHPGETQEMVVALVGGHGDNYLNSISVMKENIEEIKKQYGRPIPKVSYTISHPNNSTCELYFVADLSGFNDVTNCSIVLKSDFGLDEITIKLNNDGSNNDKLAGDNLWSNILKTQNKKYPFSGKVNINSKNDFQVFEDFLQNVRIRPFPAMKNWRIVWENATQDSKCNNGETVQMQFDVLNKDSLNAINTLRFTRRTNSTRMAFNTNVAPSSTLISDSLYFFIGGFGYFIKYPSKEFEYGNKYYDSYTLFYNFEFDHHYGLDSTTISIFRLDSIPAWGDTADVKSIIGVTDNVSPTVADPSLITEHTYRINFFKGDSSNGLLWQLTDWTAGKAKTDCLSVIDLPGHHGQIVDGIHWRVKQGPFLIKNWTYSSGAVSPLYPDYDRGRSVSGNNWGGRALFGGLGMAHIFWGEDPGISPEDIPIIEIRFTHMTSYDDTNNDGEYTFGPNGGESYYFNISEGQKAFMYMGLDKGNYNAFNYVPFQVWDVSDPQNPRQLNLILHDYDQNEQWDFETDEGPSNYVWIMADTYDPSGEAWDGSTAEKDFMEQLTTGSIPAYYTLWAAQRGDRPMLAESGIITVFPYSYNVPGDILEVALSPLTISKIPVPNILHQNYPNPFNPTTRIDFGLIKNSKVKLEIFNILGQRIKTLINTSLAAGVHTAFWDGKNEVGKLTATGLYFYRLSADKFVKTKKMILIR